MSSRLVFLLGDQLSDSISSLRDADRHGTCVFMCEVRGEVDAAAHHIKKLIFLFSAMRHRAARLREAGFQVDYITLDDPANTGTLTGELSRAIERHAPATVVITEPGEWRVLDALQRWAADTATTLTWREDDRFLCSRERFTQWAGRRKTLRMEYFYRDMRRHTGLLLDGGKPAGGRWNYDTDNRKPLDAEAARRIVGPLRVAPDAVVSDVTAMLARLGIEGYGEADDFWFAVRPQEAERALDHFIDHALADFGDYQDAMAQGVDFGFHALLSVYLNAGLLDPWLCCQRAEAAWRAGAAPLNAVEGFIRQIIGWREFIRGIYWLHMPDYAQRNVLQANLDLPAFYWSGETGMNCIRQTVSGIRRNAYAHHIQRLMVTGNFALIAGLDVKQVCDWYLGVFADAYEWVELPNTLGMALYGDGGLFASKPYAASGKYIHRMSDYCAGCRYRPQDSTGELACPFNYLYWDFIARQAPRLSGNARMGMIYRSMARMDGHRLDAMRDQAARARRDLDAL